MAHVDDLTLVNSAQIAAADNVYLAKLGDADPDRRAALSELAKYLGGSSDLIAALKTALPIEQGTWTPELRSAGGALTITYSTREGYYHRIGTFVFITARIIVGTITTPPADQARIRGFPHARDSLTPAAPFRLYVTEITVGGMGFPVLDFASNSELRMVYLNSAAGPSSITVAQIKNGATIIFAGSYLTT